MLSSTEQLTSRYKDIYLHIFLCEKQKHYFFADWFFMLLALYSIYTNAFSHCYTEPAEKLSQSLIGVCVCTCFTAFIRSKNEEPILVGCNVFFGDQMVGPKCLKGFLSDKTRSMASVRDSVMVRHSTVMVRLRG